MGAKFDDLKEFRKKLETLTKEKDLFLEACTKELAARLLRKVIKRTPVGQKPKFDKKTVKVKGDKGKTKTFLSKEGEIYEKYWSGYQGGTLRRGWTSKTFEEAKSGGKRDVLSFVDSVSITKKGHLYQIEIVNPVPYAPYVEYGHRQQVGKYVPALGKKLKKGWVKGRFMLTISVEELQRSSPAILETKLKKWLGGAM